MTQLLLFPSNNEPNLQTSSAMYLPLLNLHKSTCQLFESLSSSHALILTTDQCLLAMRWQKSSFSLLQTMNQFSNPLQQRVCRYPLFDSPLEYHLKTLSSNNLASNWTGSQWQPLIQHRKMTSLSQQKDLFVQSSSATYLPLSFIFYLISWLLKWLFCTLRHWSFGLWNEYFTRSFVATINPLWRPHAKICMRSASRATANTGTWSTGWSLFVFNFHIYFFRLSVDCGTKDTYSCLWMPLKNLAISSQGGHLKIYLIKNKEQNLQQFSKIPGYCGKWVTGIARNSQ